MQSSKLYISLAFYKAEEGNNLGKYIALFGFALVATVVIAVTVVLNFAPGQTVASAAPPTYMHTLTNNEQEKFIVTNLTDGRLVRLQLIVELAANYAPLDVKKPNRELLALQDALLQVVRSCRSDDLDPQNQAAFKQRIKATAEQIIGKRAVFGVYFAAIALQ